MTIYEWFLLNKHALFQAEERVYSIEQLQNHVFYACRSFEDRLDDFARGTVLPALDWATKILWFSALLDEEYEERRNFMAVCLGITPEALEDIAQQRFEFRLHRGTIDEHQELRTLEASWAQV